MNITDTDAKIMKRQDGSKNPSYNLRFLLIEKEQIIVAADLVDEENDLHQIEPMIENVKETLGYKPNIVLADAGYFSYDNVKFLLDEEIDAYIPDNFYEVEKRGKTKKLGNHSSLMMIKKTVIIALLHLKSNLQESKKGKMNQIYDNMSVSIALCVC